MNLANYHDYFPEQRGWGRGGPATGAQQQPYQQAGMTCIKNACLQKFI